METSTKTAPTRAAASAFAWSAVKIQTKRGGDGEKRANHSQLQRLSTNAHTPPAYLGAMRGASAAEGCVIKPAPAGIVVLDGCRMGPHRPDDKQRME